MTIAATSQIPTREQIREMNLSVDQLSMMQAGLAQELVRWLALREEANSKAFGPMAYADPAACHAHRMVVSLQDAYAEASYLAFAPEREKAAEASAESNHGRGPYVEPSPAAISRMERALGA